MSSAISQSATAAAATAAAGVAAGSGVISAPQEPRTSRMIAVLLQSMGVDEVEPRVIHQLTELLHRMTGELLEEARECALHAGRAAVNVSDLRLASDARTGVQFVSPPSTDVLMRIAASVNRREIPAPRRDRNRVRLPDEAFCLTMPSYELHYEEPKESAAPASSADLHSVGGGPASTAPVTLSAVPIILRPVAAGEPATKRARSDDLATTSTAPAVGISLGVPAAAAPGPASTRAVDDDLDDDLDDDFD
ncbi:hypothetical protein H696_01114 [Fonticula alba]|uniref:Transcription initiation factor TFIID subunit 9B n=1 Tax=Fonticula alba TaxID=691883 RepID=A0A058ZB88_FONAL|nr:hypothetical protein H696_01114 [Fonticula alba]KCV71690.1 hypothetical protein H696_01114 [Fonticula alba]|eukprot:XP_009493268.1 hypothetical protein H696_01114 [Fonticula alba]